MSHEVVKDDTGQKIYALVVHNDDNTSVPFTAMDVGYTIAQNYREILLGDNVYLSKTFPLSCMGFQLDAGGNIPEEMRKSGTEFYFDADGLFYFKDDKAPNPDRAVEEFLALHEQGKVVFGPSCAVMVAEVSHVHVSKGPGATTTIYLYSE